MTVFRLSLALVLTLARSSTLMAQSEGERLLEKARLASGPRYDYAVLNGAEIRATDDGRSFYVFWRSRAESTTIPPPVIVTLHGHASWAFDEFYLWHPHASERGYAILALQWWFGKGEKLEDYYLPNEVYRTVAPLLDRLGLGRGRALLHGFSRGSANIYAVVAVDTWRQSRYFGLTIANAGKPGLDFPANVDIERGMYGPHPFEGTHWVTVCGMLDPNPGRDGCPGMDEAARWVSGLGGVIDLRIEDPAGDHGAFHRNPANVRAALDAFATRLAEPSHGDRNGEGRRLDGGSVALDPGR